MAIAVVTEPVIGAFCVSVDGGSRIIKCESRDAAENLCGVFEMVYSMGQRKSRHEIREALGLHTWGGTVTCKDN